MRRWRGRCRHHALTACAFAALAVAGCASGAASPREPAANAPTAPNGTATTGGHHDGTDMQPADRAAAQLASAAYQDLDVALSAGYASTLDTLGCFQDPVLGGMGLHYVDQTLMDATVDITEPEALVYELDADKAVTGLVAHEYIVPVEAWTSADPPTLFGVPFHRHPTLPLWVLHTWLWKDNVAGVFADWNPSVRLCPEGVPIFGRDLPAPESPDSSG